MLAPSDQAPYAVGDAGKEKHQRAGGAAEAALPEKHGHFSPQGQGKGCLQQKQAAHRTEAEGGGIRPKGRQGHKGLRRCDAHQ